MRSRFLNKALPFFLLLLAIAAAYSEIFSFAFVYDDEFLIQKNRFLDSFAQLGALFTGSSTAGAGFHDSFYRPLQGFLYLIVQQLFGRETEAFHTLNLLLHFGNACLIYAIGKRMRLPSFAAFLAALLWALHPLHTEAVTYMSATADVLHVLFILLGTLVLLPNFEWKQVGLSCAFFSLALLSKEAAIVFPALVMTLIFFFSQNRKSWHPYLKSMPSWALAFIYLGLRKTVLNFNGDFEMYKDTNIYTENIAYRIQTYLATLPSYIKLLIWPHDQHIDRSFPVYTSPFAIPVLIGLGVVLFGLFLFWKSWRSQTSQNIWWTWVFLWFFASQATQSGILIPVNSFFLEHWMYLPSISFALGIGALAKAFSEKVHQPFFRRSMAGLVLVIASALGVATYLQNRMWKSPITLFSRILSYNPGADRVRHNLAMAYSDLGDDDHALQEYQIVLKNTDRYPQTYHNVARIYFKKGLLDEAEKNEQIALQKDPQFFPAYASLVEISELRGNRQAADEYRKKYDELTR